MLKSKINRLRHKINPPENVINRGGVLCVTDALEDVVQYLKSFVISGNKKQFVRFLAADCLHHVSQQKLVDILTNLYDLMLRHHRSWRGDLLNCAPVVSKHKRVLLENINVVDLWHGRICWQDKVVTKREACLFLKSIVVDCSIEHAEHVFGGASFPSNVPPLGLTLFSFNHVPQNSAVSFCYKFLSHHRPQLLTQVQQKCWFADPIDIERGLVDACIDLAFDMIEEPQAQNRVPFAERLSLLIGLPEANEAGFFKNLDMNVIGMLFETGIDHPLFKKIGTLSLSSVIENPDVELKKNRYEEMHAWFLAFCLLHQPELITEIVVLKLNQTVGDRMRQELNAKLCMLHRDEINSELLQADVRPSRSSQSRKI